MIGLPIASPTPRQIAALLPVGYRLETCNGGPWALLDPHSRDWAGMPHQDQAFSMLRLVRPIEDCGVER